MNADERKSAASIIACYPINESTYNIDRLLFDSAVKMLAHIDSQAEELSRTYQMIYGMAKAGNEYPRIIEKQAEQIATLKAYILQTARFMYLTDAEKRTLLGREIPEVDWSDVE